MFGLRIPVVLTLAMLAAPLLADEPRTWTDAKTKRTMEAEIVGVSVLVKKTTGGTVTIPLDHLSDTDRRFLAHWLLAKAGESEVKSVPPVIVAPRASTPSFTPSAPKEVRVKGYTRKDGTYVQPYTRSKPKAK